MPDNKLLAWIEPRNDRELGQHSCLSLRRRAVLQPPIAVPRRRKRESGLRSKLLHSVFRSSGPPARRPDGDDLPHHPRRARLSG